MAAQALPSRSTNVAEGAPRLSASMPAAPLPANRSRNGPRSAPAASSAAKSDSLTRSVSGRVPAGGDSRRVPRALPATTRPPSAIGTRFENLARTDALQPARGDLVLQLRELRREPAARVNDLLGHAARVMRQ